MDRFYVVTNSEVYHLTQDAAPEGSAACGFAYQADTASVVSQRPGDGFRVCLNCEPSDG